jgi:O-antigen ligase
MKVNSRNTDTSSFWLFLLELPFWLCFSYWSLLADTLTPKFDFLSIPVNVKDLVLIAVACFYLLLLILTNFGGTTNDKPWNWHCHLPILTVFLLFYAAVSIQRSGIDASNARAMTYTLVLTASAFLLGYILLARRSITSVRPFLWRLTVYLAVLGLLYSVASLFSLGMGDVRADLNAGASEFGIVRVQGPLFGSSTGYFILVPALAFAIQESMQSHTRRLFKLTVVMALTLTIIGLGSRAALLIMGLFFLCLIFFMKNKKQAIIAAIMMIILISTATIIIYSRASSDRIKSFEDTTRSDTYLTSFQIISHRNTELNITGSGYGSYWSWYLTDMDDMRVGAGNGAPVILVYPFGYLLYHPHSTFLLCVVELGIPGLIYFSILWIVLVRLLRNRQGIESAIFNSGIFASGFSMFFDFFIFKGGQLSLIWWVYLFGALALNASFKNGQKENNKIAERKLIQAKEQKTLISKLK